jgi:hypothetical protein
MCKKLVSVYPTLADCGYVSGYRPYSSMTSYRSREIKGARQLEKRHIAACKTSREDDCKLQLIAVLYEERESCKEVSCSSCLYLNSVNVLCKCAAKVVLGCWIEFD